MLTMSRVWVSVIVLVSIQKVFGNVCTSHDINELTCDECIRCGAEWCREPSESPHCSFTSGDGWCPNNREYRKEVQGEPDKKGADINPVYAERTLYIGEPTKIDIHYSAKSKQKPEMMKIFNIELQQYETKCSGANCVTTIEATASQEFCNATGGVTESVVVKINLGLSEEAHVKYSVACACECSKKMVISSPVCNKQGNFSCGACFCDPGWTGQYCEKSTKLPPNCDEKRGDINQCSLNPINDADCSRNGYCGPCETCICYTDRDGSQYFDQENNCAGLCSVASECEDCLVNNTIGECTNCNHLMTMLRYNESRTTERDAQDKKVWVKCQETIDDCGQLEFYAQRDEQGEIFVMMLNHCNEISAAAVVADSKVPIILGVLGIVAVVAAISGVMLWKHMNTVPPVPLNDPQYQNIDAEDCTGENPLYKPPTSSFKNPTYGKW